MSVTIETAKPSWLKTGQAATAAFQAAEYQAKKAAEAANKMRRFALKEGEEKQITFLDGQLDSDGALIFQALNEHTVKVGQNWDNFICVSGTEICPLCTQGVRADFVGVLTVINHTPYTIKSGQNAGKVIVNQRQLFVAKMNTLKKLQAIATKRSGLRGWRVEASRTGPKDARVGDSFQFLDRADDAKLLAEFPTEHQAADYAKELTYLDAKQLLAAGLGVAPSGPGLSKNGGGITDKDLLDTM